MLKRLLRREDPDRIDLRCRQRNRWQKIEFAKPGPDVLVEGRLEAQCNEMCGGGHGVAIGCLQVLLSSYGRVGMLFFFEPASAALQTEFVSIRLSVGRIPSMRGNCHYPKGLCICRSALC